MGEPPTVSISVAVKSPTHIASPEAYSDGDQDTSPSVAISVLCSTAMSLTDADISILTMSPSAKILPYTLI